MKVRGDNSATVIDVNHVPREKEIANERDNSAVCCTYGLSSCSTKINTEMTTGQRSIEHSPASESARHD